MEILPRVNPSWYATDSRQMANCFKCAASVARFVGGQPFAPAGPASLEDQRGNATQWLERSLGGRLRDDDLSAAIDHLASRGHGAHGAMKMRLEDGGLHFFILANVNGRVYVPDGQRNPSLEVARAGRSAQPGVMAIDDPALLRTILRDRIGERADDGFSWARQVRSLEARGNHGDANRVVNQNTLQWFMRLPPGGRYEVRPAPFTGQWRGADRIVATRRSSGFARRRCALGCAERLWKGRRAQSCGTAKEHRLLATATRPSDPSGVAPVMPIRHWHVRVTLNSVFRASSHRSTPVETGRLGHAGALLRGSGPEAARDQGGSNLMSIGNSEDARIEVDSLGEVYVPRQMLYGSHTVRALENFPITGVPIGSMRELVRAYGAVKKAAAIANCELGSLAPAKAQVIGAASDELMAGALDAHLVVDIMQGGAGTSTNMNVNEVVANRGLQMLGHAAGQYGHLHPIDDVNRSQSTNDTYPTAVKLGLYFMLESLLDEMSRLRVAFEAKAREFSHILKIGRTQLQDAVPMTLGQEFSVYAVMLGEDEQRLREARSLITEVNLGATAIGTGINADPRYGELVCGYLASITGVPLVQAPNLIEATQDTGAFIQLSGVLKRLACKLSKVCNDLRLLSSGPQAGLAEIFLPPRAAGSSIMPGKVNPIIPEVVNQIAFVVVGNDMTVTMAAEAGQLQLNAFEPVICVALTQSIRQLTAACRTLRSNCIEGIAANEALLAVRVQSSASLATALTPRIGYEASARIAKEALRSGRSVADLVVELQLMRREEALALLQPDALTRPAARD